jgi:tetratricopeptide (TPR) repeat protein
LDAAEAAAEAALRAGELQIAESRYRSLLLDAWMLKGELHVAAGRLDAARDAFQRATASAVDAAAAVHSLALVHLQTGQPADAVALLTKLAGLNPRDQRTRRLLAQALIANGEPDEAVQTLEEARAGAPDDPELAFVLASGYVRQKKIAAAEQLFARVIAARPIPETYVLIGRTYRDAGIFDRARAFMEKALEKNPRTRRAHYYLGTLAVMAEGVVRLDDAIGEFREELKVSPDDPLTNLRLGMALVERRRPSEALKPLEIATGAPWANSDAFQYLGRCQLALDRPADAVTSLRRALELSRSGPPDDVRLRHIHYQLALALRRVGAGDEAAVHFAEAEQIAARRAGVDREQLARYLADAPALSREETSTVLPLQSSFSGLAPPQRAELDRRATTALARAYLNLGVIHAQARRFARAAEFFAHAADVAPDFPQVQYSLGVAYFNAEQYEKAVAPLGRALAADSANADVRRMLALASLNAGSYDKAAELLAPDARRDSDPSLQYAYALALVRSNRAAEAEAVFAQLLAHHGTTPELQVLVGQAHAQQGDFESAIASLQGALKVKPDVADAQATLGMIYLQQGKLPEARTALRAGLEVRPGDVHAAHTLATVLDLEGQSEEAAAILGSILRSRPDFANARYLLGKILLARGAADEAVEQLEAGARLAPEDPNIHYQLAQAYRKQGRTELSDKRLEIYQQLKEKRRSR